MNALPLFANSGHHFYFVPLDRFTPSGASGADESAEEEIKRLCRDDNLPWSVAPEQPWVRYRPGRSGEGPDTEVGFWVAVESNVGTPERGLVYDFEKPIVAREASPDRPGPATPYAYADVNQISQEPLNLAVAVVHPRDGRTLGTLEVPPIQWIRPNASVPIDVDLVIDFGNTRTVALLVECRETDHLGGICRPVRFVRRGTNHAPFEHGSAVEDPCSIVDSWIVLHETLFADHEPPSDRFEPRTRYQIGELGQGTFDRMLRRPARTGVVAETKYMPQMFVELSPALLGGGNGLDGARQVLRETRLEHDKNFFLSSPKRYAWDDDPMGSGGRPFWNIELNRWNPRKDEETPHQLPQPRGPVFLFMDHDGRHWDLDAGEPPPNEREEVHRRPHANGCATHPRRDSLTWAALTVLETAYRQIMSDSYRNVHLPYSPRRLRQVLVTFPSGWTTRELENYRKQWQKAVNIFGLGHLADRRRVDQGGQRPILITDLDEAVASQLPMIYSESLRLREAGAWLALVGRSGGRRPIVRIMNIDIGGGTTDVAIAEYRDTMSGRSVNLNATLLFKNSNTIAGDNLVKRVIERVLLPELAATLNAERREDFAQFFRDPREEWIAQVPTLRRKMARIVHLALVPIVHHWLKEAGEGRYGADGNSGLPPERMLDRSNQRVVDPNMVAELNELTRQFVGQSVLNESEPLNYDQNKVAECVRELFAPLFRSYGKLVAAFDCDLVFVSGKPSELPQIQELLQEALPVPPGRVQLAKGFEVGSWYPVGAPSGKITDAKTITVVGAALRQAMTNGLIRGWKLTYTPPNPALAAGNYWGLMPDADAPEQFERNILLNPAETRKTCEIMLGERIGRMRYRSPSLMPDQIYLLRWRPGRGRPEKNLALSVTFERVSDNDFSELLKIVDVRGKDRDGRPVGLDDVELQLRTLPDDAFWMDNPRFDFHEEG